MQLTMAIQLRAAYAADTSCSSAPQPLAHCCLPVAPHLADHSILSGTSLVAVLTTACISTATFAANGCIDLPASLLIAPPAVLLAPLGARFTSRLNCNALKRLLGWFLVVAAPLVPLKAYMFASRAEQLAAESAAGEAAGGGAAAAAVAAATASSPAEAPGSGGGSIGGSGGDDDQSSGWQAELQRLRDGMPSPLRAAALVATGGLSGFISGLLGVGGGTTGGLLLLHCMLLPALAVNQNKSAAGRWSLGTLLASLASSRLPCPLLRPVSVLCMTHCSGSLPLPAAATPLVALIMPYSQATVLGTTLAAMVPTTAAAVAQHQRCGWVGNTACLAVAADGGLS